MNPRIKKIVKIATIVLLPIFLQAFAVARNKKRLVKEVRVNHSTQDMYVTEATIRRMIFKDPQEMMPLALLRLDELENTLNEHVMIEKSDVFCTVDGILEANVKQREPIARIYDKEKMFYMDSRGEKMPLSGSFSARVPLVTGNVSEKYWKDTYDLILFIRNDDFLNKNITNVKVRSNGEYEFLMRVPEFKVIVGKLDNLEQKTANLKAFYTKMERSKMLNIYKSVNLKYSNQVVCTK